MKSFYMLTLQIQNHLNMADNLEFSINREGDLWKKSMKTLYYYVIREGQMKQSHCNTMLKV